MLFVKVVHILRSAIIRWSVFGPVYEIWSSGSVLNVTGGERGDTVSDKLEWTSSEKRSH